MKTMSIEQIESVNGEGWRNVATAACGIIGSGSAIYAVGTATNWWNPVGWVSASFLVADLVCVGYGASQLF